MRFPPRDSMPDVKNQQIFLFFRYFPFCYFIIAFWGVLCSLAGIMLSPPLVGGLLYYGASIDRDVATLPVAE